MPGRWDETLYAGSAEFYVQGRMPYPQRLADALQQALRLDGRGRLLDLGCGPGSLTLLVAPLFAEVVAVDADADMLRVGRRLAGDAGMRNVRWLHGRAEDLPEDLGGFDVVTLAQSWHWMDQPVVAARLRRLVVPGGWCVHVGATTHEGVPDARGLQFPQPPREKVAALVRSYLGPRRRAGRGFAPDDMPDQDVALREAGFDGPRRVEVPCGDVVMRTEDQVVASVLSLSSASPHLLGPRLDEFVADLRALLRAAAPDGVFAERLPDITLRLFRQSVSG